MLVSYTASTRRRFFTDLEQTPYAQKKALVLLVALVGPLLVLVEGVELLGAF